MLLEVGAVPGRPQRVPNQRHLLNSLPCFLHVLPPAPTPDFVRHAAPPPVLRSVVTHLLDMGRVDGRLHDTAAQVRGDRRLDYMLVALAASVPRLLLLRGRTRRPILAHARRGVGVPGVPRVGQCVALFDQDDRRSVGEDGGRVVEEGDVGQPRLAHVRRLTVPRGQGVPEQERERGRKGDVSMGPIYKLTTLSFDGSPGLS